MGITVLLAMLTVVAINGSLGDQSSDGKYLYIVQSELERSGSGLTEVADNRELLLVTDEELTKQSVQNKYHLLLHCHVRFLILLQLLP